MIKGTHYVTVVRYSYACLIMFELPINNSSIYTDNSYLFLYNLL